MITTLALLTPLAHSFDPVPLQTFDGRFGMPFAGIGVAVVGDTDGDGFDDLFVGADGYGHVFLGGPNGPGAEADVLLTGPTPRCIDCSVGEHVVGGDANSDGYADVAYLTYCDSDGFALEVRYGGSAGLPAAPDLTLPGFVFDIGWGDVNGDGYDDLVVGAAIQSVDGWGGSANGIAVYLGGAMGVDSEPTYEVIPYTTGSDFVVGDVDGDGYDDVIDHGYDVLYGGPTGLGADWLLGGWLPITDGNSSAVADLDGDGIGDLLLGNGDVYLGQPAKLPATPDRTITTFPAAMASDVRAVGDVDGDGYGDVLYGFDGELRLLYGDATHPTFETWSDPQFPNGYDLRLGGGDVNGDGYADIVYGSRNQQQAALRFGGPTGLAPSPQRWNQATRSLEDVVSFGDINGDGYEDVGIVRYEEWVEGFTVHLGSAAGIESEEAAFWLGSEAARGDLDGDGQSDVLVYDGSSWRVYYGGVAGPGASSAQVLLPTAVGYKAKVGDANGDGYDDVAFESGSSVVMFYGRATGLTAAPDQMGPPLERQPGTFADVDGDGFDDLVLFRDEWNGSSETFVVDVRHGSSKGLGPVVQISKTLVVGIGEDPSEMTAGDYNGDGFDDVALLGVNRTRVWFGSAAGLDPGTEQDLGDRWLTSAPIGRLDVTGDGVDDLVVGGRHEGVVLWAGGPTGLGPLQQLLKGDDDETGHDIAAADVDGDGQPELLVLAADWNRLAGRVYVFGF